MSLKYEVLSGVLWSGGGKLANQALQFAVMIVMARLLTPRDFGLMAMILTFTGCVTLFTEMGLSSALIQRKDLEPRHCSSIFWVSLMLGSCIAVAAFLSAGWIAAFYNAPALAPLLKLISINFVIGGVSLVPYSILVRNMQFRKLSMINTAGVGVAGATAILLAYNGFGAWSLVWQAILASLLPAAALWIASGWTVKFLLEWRAVRELLGFGGNLAAFNFVNYWIRNLDNVLIGKYMGSAPLGLYSRAYGTMQLPLTTVSAPIGSVLFPALCAVQDNQRTTQAMYLRFTGTVALVTFPMMLGLVAIADSFVVGLFGPQWAPMIPVLRIFCLVGLAQSIGTTVGWVFMSQGRTDLFLKTGLLTSIPLLASIALGVWIGSIQAVAICYAVATLAVEYPCIAVAARLIGLRMAEVLQRLASIFIRSACMAGLVWALGRILPERWPPQVHLAIGVLFGMAVYFSLLEAFHMDAYREAKQLLLDRWRSRLAPPPLERSALT